ncbi:membrane hypothetical protein [Azospirillaceae bacterium]
MNWIISLMILWFVALSLLIYGIFAGKKTSLKKYFLNKKQLIKDRVADKISETFFKVGGGGISIEESKNLQKNGFSWFKKIQSLVWVFSLSITFFIILPLFKVNNDKILIIICFMSLSYIIFLPKSIKKELNNKD